jgi:hypothetical protein
LFGGNVDRRCLHLGVKQREYLLAQAAPVRFRSGLEPLEQGHGDVLERHVEHVFHQAPFYEQVANDLELYLIDHGLEERGITLSRCRP